MSSDLAILAEGIGKRYRTGATQGIGRYRSLREDISNLATRRAAREAKREFWALQEISFEIHAGETVGIIGRNGAGKSTLLKILARITPPTSGRGKTFGRVGSLLEVGTGFHPELTGRENIMLAAAIMGMSRAEVLSRFDDIVEFSGLSKFLETPVKRYSSGMYMRLAFSVAAHLEPEILLVDEVLSVGDADFQKKCLGRMEDLSGSGRTVVFVSHSMPAVLRLCPRVILLDAGRVKGDGSGSQVIEEYMRGGGGSAERGWPDMAAAPGDDQVRLQSARVVDDNGKTLPEVDIRDQVFVEVTYRSLAEEADFRPFVSLAFYNAEGTLLFISQDHSDLDSSRKGPGLVRARCRVPGNFFAEGVIFVTVVIGSHVSPRVRAVANDAVAFHVVDHGLVDGARGPWVGDYPGAVRPLLDWTVTREP